MKKKPAYNVRNEKGFVLITGLMILVMLTMLGIAATRNTSIELQIAGNDRIHKETFYEAESMAVVATEILEQNFNCITGFQVTNAAAGAVPASADLLGSIRTYDRAITRGTTNPKNAIAFWRNMNFVYPNVAPNNNSFTEFQTDNTTPNTAYYVGNPIEADAAYPITQLDSGGNAVLALDPNGDGDPSDDLPGTNYLYIAGQTQMLPGGALQMAAGYEGKGKGAGGGGVGKIIDIYSQFRGALNSESIVLVGWRHLVNTEGDCVY